jgi:hypothetical protein
MTLREVFENVVPLLGVEKGQHAPDFIRTRVVQDVNSALQLMATGVDYFNRDTVSVNITTGNASVDLPDYVLNAYAPVRLSTGLQLVEIKTRGELDNFAYLHLGRTSAASAAAPTAYFLDVKRRPASEDVENNLKATLIVAPTPDANYTVILEASRRPENFVVGDLSHSKPIPVPQNFAASVLLPIVRWNVRTCHFFNAKDQLPAIESEYSAALTQLGLLTPRIDKGETTGSALERKRAAARNAAREAYANTQ